MSFADGPLAYCANVHPATTLSQMQQNLEKVAVPLADRFGRPFAVGLWLPRSAINNLSAYRAQEFADWLQRRGLICTTMNAFPFGDFHAARVKENVYTPDWRSLDRSDYTCRTAELLARLLPESATGSISTLPCGYRALLGDVNFKAFFPMLIEAVRHLAWLKATTGRTIRLAIEPEPGCLLEKTDDVVRFFRKLWNHAAQATLPHGAKDEALVREHLGLCFDVCHAAVMHEDSAAAIQRLHAAGVRIVKVQLSSAVELAAPTDVEARRFLTRFVEERYLHQTVAVHPTASLLFKNDLTVQHALTPPREWLECPDWRIHFHVPLHRETMGPLLTTSSSILPTLRAIAVLPYAPDLEIETYTWHVMPSETDEPPPFNLVDGLAAELDHAYRLLRRARSPIC